MSMDSVHGGRTFTRTRTRRRAALAKRPPARPAVVGRLRAWNVVAAFNSPGEARRACAAIRGAHLEGAAITASQAAEDTGEVRLGGYASDRTVGGGLLGALAGLVVGALVANASGAATPVEVMAALLFCTAGGGAVGGMVAGASDPAGGDRLNAVLDRLSEGRLVHVAVHCNAADDAALAAQVLAGLGPVDLYCLGPEGQLVW